MISTIYENNAAAVKVENQGSSWFHIKSGVKQGCVLSLFIWITLMSFVLTGKAMGEHRIKWGRQTFLDLGYANELSILDESMSKID